MNFHHVYLMVIMILFLLILTQLPCCAKNFLFLKDAHLYHLFIPMLILKMMVLSSMFHCFQSRYIHILQAEIFLHPIRLLALI